MRICMFQVHFFAMLHVMANTILQSAYIHYCKRAKYAKNAIIIIICSTDQDSNLTDSNLDF